MHTEPLTNAALSDFSMISRKLSPLSSIILLLLPGSPDPSQWNFGHLQPWCQVDHSVSSPVLLPRSQMKSRAKISATLRYEHESVGSTCSWRQLFTHNAEQRAAAATLAKPFLAESKNKLINKPLHFYYWWPWNIIRQYLQDKSKD